jgi:4-hydroxybenzoate polyprenyltransferase
MSELHTVSKIDNAGGNEESHSSLPLVIDLDGTFLATDTLYESIILCLKRKPLSALRIPIVGFASGRANAKSVLATTVSEEDVARFPINAALLEYAECEASKGREVVLATAADKKIAELVTHRFPFFSKIISSDGDVNLKGQNKASALQLLFPNGFVYAGDSIADIYVWRQAVAGIFAGTSTHVLKQARVATTIVMVAPSRARLSFQSLRRALRLHQWAKNILVFVPLVLGGKSDQVHTWLRVLMAFFAFGLLASGNYLLNDLWDLNEDRQHWSKKMRPIASGEIEIVTGVWLMALCGLSALWISSTIGTGCVESLLCYLGLSLLYSFRFKREPIFDVLILAMLFTVRLATGAIVSEVVLSPWLFVFSMFVFLSLSLAKRQTELSRAALRGRVATDFGRGYSSEDAPFILASGISTMFAAVIILTIYLMEDAFPKGFYRRPSFLWGSPVVIFLWLARIWLVCHRGQLYDDPVAFALKDRVSLLYAALMLVFFIGALL